MKRTPRYAAIYEAFEHAVDQAHMRPAARLTYRKVGNMVHITGRVTWPSGPSHRVTISGLPFVAKRRRRYLRHRSARQG